MAPTTDHGTPGGRPPQTQTVEGRDIAIDAAGATDIGAVVAGEAEVKEVRVLSDQQDLDFNIELNGNDTFANEQSPAAAEESFVPDQNTRVGGVGDAELVFDVSSASATAGATATVLVVTEYRH